MEIKTARDFNKNYAKKGGIMALTEMRALMITQDFIAKQFGVSKEGVRWWMDKFFGGKYDPREPRREAIINSMLDFATHNSQEEFLEVYKKSEYLQVAINRALERGIYKSDEL